VTGSEARQEAWLRGPIAGIDPLLQPVAHALTHALEDVPRALESVSDDDLWRRPGNSAPIGYHLAHLTGSLDRLFTYARGEALSATQRSALDAERNSAELRPSLAQLLVVFQSTVERALAQLRATPADTLLDVRHVGRARIPSTTMGILFHAAEHTARHNGQILTLVRVVRTHTFPPP
jgi:uncharacterized damage-inducible protein DinB